MQCSRFNVVVHLLLFFRLFGKIKFSRLWTYWLTLLQTPSTALGPIPPEHSYIHKNYTPLTFKGPQRTCYSDIWKWYQKSSELYNTRLTIGKTSLLKIACCSLSIVTYGPNFCFSRHQWNGTEMWIICWPQKLWIRLEQEQTAFPRLLILLWIVFFFWNDRNWEIPVKTAILITSK